MLAHWTVPPLAVVLALALAAHEYGRRRLVRGRGDGRALRDARHQAWLARAGLGWGVLTLVSPLGYWSHALLPARVGLDLSFSCLVAPLVVLGAPWAGFAAAGAFLSRRSGRDRDSQRRPPVRPAPAGPATAIVAFFAVLLVWQFPAVLDASVRSAALWSVQIVCYLVAGTLLWLQLVGSHPFQPGWDPARRLGLLSAALAGLWIAGVAVVISARVRYPAFAPGPIGRVMDQGMAGAIACVLPLIPFGVAAFWCFAEWLTKDEDDGRLELAAEPAEPGAPPGPNPVTSRS